MSNWYYNEANRITMYNVFDADRYHERKYVPASPRRDADWVLRRQRGWSVGAISVLYGISRATVYTRLKKAAATAELDRADRWPDG